MPKEIIEDIVEDIKEEANEKVGTVTFKRWQVVAGAVIVTIALLALIL